MTRTRAIEFARRRIERLETDLRKFTDPDDRRITWMRAEIEALAKLVKIAEQARDAVN